MSVVIKYVLIDLPGKWRNKHFKKRYSTCRARRQDRSILKVMTKQRRMRKTERTKIAMH